MTYPSQVVDELRRFATGDLPALWAVSSQRYLKFSDPPPEYVRRVLREASDVFKGRARTVVDPNKTYEDADPYVTTDRFDTPSRISIVTACQILKLSFQGTQDFLRSLSFSV